MGYESVERRKLATILAAAGLASGTLIRAEGQATEGGESEPEVLRLGRNGWMPNNEHLPVLLFRQALRQPQGCQKSRRHRPPSPDWPR